MLSPCTIFRAAITADFEGNKASVRSESADGIPKFWSDEKICGRLPSSPPTESPWRHLTFPPSAVALHVKTVLTMKRKGWLQRKKPMLHETWIRWNCKCNLQFHQAPQFQCSFTKSPQASLPKCEPAIVERMRNHERLSLAMHWRQPTYRKICQLKFARCRRLGANQMASSSKSAHTFPASHKIR